MSDTTTPLPWKHVSYILTLFAPLWLGAVILFASLGLCYSISSKDYWTASQPMVLRDEADGAAARLGRFGSQTELKAAQETILEMARNHEVVRTALKKIGPTSFWNTSSWPSNEAVSAIAKKRVNIRAPQGGEFGGSEMIYLQVEEADPDRAAAFCEAMYEALAQQMRDVRRVRADSMINELTHARDMARNNLEQSLARMREMEVQFGSDLGELRNLSETVIGDGANRRELDVVNRELQTAELELEKLQSLYELLEQGLRDPSLLLVSGEKLSRQQSLQRLKDGLIDAQIARSKLGSQMTDENPKMKAARATENRIRSEMQAETALVMRSTQPVIAVELDRVERLRAKQQNLQRRLDRLAEGRTTYSKLAADVKHRTSLLESAQRVLASAEASRSASLSVNLLAKLGPVSTGDSPNGMPTSMLTVGGGAAGLIFGLGTVFLVAPGPNQSRIGRRWSDMLGGRRATDRGLATGKTTQDRRLAARDERRAS